MEEYQHEEKGGTGSGNISFDSDCSTNRFPYLSDKKIYPVF